MACHYQTIQGGKPRKRTQPQGDHISLSLTLFMSLCLSLFTILSIIPPLTPHLTPHPTAHAVYRGARPRHELSQSGVSTRRREVAQGKSSVSNAPGFAKASGCSKRSNQGSGTRWRTRALTHAINFLRTANSEQENEFFLTHRPCIAPGSSPHFCIQLQ